MAENVDYFLRIDGIDGECRKPGFEKCMEMFDWGFSESQDGSASSPSASAQGRVSMSDFNFSKVVDTATPKLLQNLFKGTLVAKATLTARRTGATEGRPQPYLVWEFKDLIISAHSFNGNNGGGTPTESISFNFAEVKCYYRQLKKGVLQGAVSGGWNLKTNRVA
ncbi:MAG: type VI secretion system tube protein Hcp [Acidobacteria bacterium]|nr:type VI secretion system tube protein Hcp [Acidobacteriota bacterium]